MTKEKSFDEAVRACAEYLRENDRYLLLTHKRADGDTCGSAAALCLCLRKLGKTAYVQKNSESTEKFQKMMSPYLPPEDFSPETIISVDVADRQLLPRDAAEVAERIDLSVDHHRTAKPVARRSLIDPEAAAAGEVVARLCGALEVPVEGTLATMIYMAIATDTGRFKYPSTTGDTLRLAALCYDGGADAPAINKLFFDTKRKSRLRLEGYIFETMRYIAGGKAAMVVITRSVMREFGINGDDMDNVSALPMQAEGIEMALTLIENPDGSHRLSVRAAEGIDAADFCACYGGGGHRGAAGAHLAEGSTEELEKELIDRAEVYMKRFEGGF